MDGCGLILKRMGIRMPRLNRHAHAPMVNIDEGLNGHTMIDSGKCIDRRLNGSDALLESGW